MKFALLFLFVCAISIDGFGINVKYGEVIINGFNECEIENNGKTFIYKSYDDQFTMEDKHLFGIVRYNCDNHTGVLISTFECKPCGIFCNYNQSVGRCRHLALPYILGGIIGIIIGVCLMYAFKFIRVRFMLWWNYKMMKANDGKQIKLATRQKIITGVTQNVSFKEMKNMKQEKMEKIEKNRAQFKNIHNSNSHIYPQVPTFVALITFGLLIGLVCPCNNNLYISSNGKVCENNKCKSLSMLTFPLQTGQAICFRDVNNDILSITVTSTYYRVQYHHIYDTSDFQIKIETRSSCGTYCDYTSCRMNMKHDEFVDKKDRVEGYNCETKSSCNRYCTSDTSCTFVHWWLEPTGNIAKVYKFTTKIWEAKILIKYKAINKVILLNLNDPSYQINNVDFSVINNLPIFINSFMGEFYYPHKNLLEDNMSFYHVDGSEMNFPESDKIGDFQIELTDNKTAIYNVNDVKCQVDYCAGSCNAPEPKLRRFRSSKNPLNEISSFEIKSKHIVLEKQKISATFNLIIGNVDIVSLDIEKAMCNINKVSSYGCIGCSQKPYVIFKANNIKREGIIMFESNCTFNKNYLSCTPEPFVLEVEELDSFCYMFMPSLNKTINVDTNIEFVGHLNPSQPEMVSESPLEIAKNALFNWDVANAAVVAMTGATIFGVSITALNRLFLVYMYRKEIHKLEKQPE